MKKINQILFILLSITMTSYANAYEFKHIKLKGKLLEKNNKLNNVLIKRNSKSFNLAQVAATEEISPILSEIIEMLTGTHANIGRAQVDRLLKNHNLGGGVLNFSGFSWHKPMANYDIKVNRELAPDIFSDKWIVHDTFSIFIEAATLIKSLEKQNKIESLSEEVLGVFAGVTFTRVYRYSHFAPTYIDGLKSDFSKLFLPILKFTPSGILNLDDYEVLKKKDTFTFNAGGILQAPPTSGLSGQAGVLVNIAYQNEVMVQKVGADDNQNGQELLRLSIDKELNQSVGAHISIQYDFFNLLKLELLRYDLTYEYAQANKTYITLNNDDRDNITKNGPKRNEIKSYLNGKDDVILWKKNIIAQEKRLNENMNSKFSFLLLGTMKKRATEQIRIIKDGVEKIFFRNYSESIKYIQSLLSRLFSDVIQRIFKFNTSVKNKAELQKTLKIEYEQIKDLGVSTVNDEDKFSIQFSQNFMVSDTHRWYHKSSYKAAIRYTQRLTTLSSDLIKKVEDKELIGPISINSTIEVEKTGLLYFNNLTRDQVKSFSLKVCGAKNLKRKSRRRHKGPRRRTYSSQQRCTIKLIDRFHDYIINVERAKHMNLLLFKKFVGLYFSKVQSYGQITDLFGKNNVFTYGNFQASRQDGSHFQTYFKSGHFRGLGVIDSFKRNKFITPVSN